MAEQRQVGFHAVGVSPEDADHLVADFDGRPGATNPDTDIPPIWNQMLGRVRRQFGNNSPRCSRDSP